MAKKTRGKTARGKATKTRKTKPEESAEYRTLIKWWDQASREERREFIEKAGLGTLLDSMPKPMRDELSALVTIEIENELARTRPATAPIDGNDQESPI